jgi:biopolymer transport protein ExbB/TolQ
LIQDLDTFPQAKVMRVFYNEFSFQPSDMAVPLMFLLTFLIICTAAVILYILIKNKILGKLRAIKFIDNIVSEFNEEDVGNNLVLEVIDYKKQKKARSEKTASQTSASNSESGVELNQTLTDQTAAQ